MPNTKDANRIRIDWQIMEPLKEAADLHYYDITGFVNYLLRMYLIGNMQTEKNPTSSINKPKADNSDNLISPETATDLPDFLSDIDIGA